MLMLRSDHIAGTALALLAALVFWQARHLPFGTIAAPGPGYWPIVLAGAMVAAGFAIVLFSGDSTEPGKGEWGGLRKVVAVLACCAFVAVSMEPLGYRVTILTAVIFLMGAVERRRPFVVAPIALLLSFGSFSLIDQYLRVPLPRGFWGF
jgi:putative tricarboxylic transport membrane protein